MFAILLASITRAQNGVGFGITPTAPWRAADRPKRWSAFRRHRPSQRAPGAPGYSRPASAKLIRSFPFTTFTSRTASLASAPLVVPASNV